MVIASVISGLIAAVGLALILPNSCALNGFNVQKYRFRKSTQAKSSTAPSDITAVTWQDSLDDLLDIDTPCEKRREKVFDLVDKASSIAQDVSSAIENRDIKILAPRKLRYGKALEGLQFFQIQLINDIVPNLLKNGLPVVPIDLKQITDAVNKAPDVIKSAIEITQDPSMLQSTLDDIRREVKNVVKPIPEGLETLKYQVLESKSSYEIRRYSPYSVCATEAMPGSAGMIGAGNSFNVLADYIFGEGNISNEKLSMTTPVITEGDRMSFVLSNGKSADTAPVPKNESVVLKDIPAQTLAYLEFPGIATESEIKRQSDLLQDSLRADGIEFDGSSIKAFQFNPPYTLPWLRTNAVSVLLTSYPLATETTAELIPSVDSEVSEIIPDDKPVFFSSPEAGD